MCEGLQCNSMQIAMKRSHNIAVLFQLFDTTHKNAAFTTEAHCTVSLVHTLAPQGH